MLKVTLGALFQASLPLGNGKKKKQPILMDLADSKVPVGTAYKINKFLEKAKPELENFDGRRKELLKKYVKKNKDGKLPEDVKDFEYEDGGKELIDKEFEELKKIEIDLDCDSLKISELSNVNLSSNDIDLIKWLLKNDL